jgi:hypothetical protein
VSLGRFSDLWKQVNERCPIAGAFLQQEWIEWSFRKIGETRSWTWLQKQGQFLVNDVITTGLAQRWPSTTHGNRRRHRVDRRGRWADSSG